MEFISLSSELGPVRLTLILSTSNNVLVITLLLVEFSLHLTGYSIYGTMSLSEVL